MDGKDAAVCEDVRCDRPRASVRKRTRFIALGALCQFVCAGCHDSEVLAATSAATVRAARRVEKDKLLLCGCAFGEDSGWLAAMSRAESAAPDVLRCARRVCQCPPPRKAHTCARTVCRLPEAVRRLLRDGGASVASPP